MSITYSNEMMNIFNSPQHVYVVGEQSNLQSFAGDQEIGEYIHLYFEFIKADDFIHSQIIKVRFSAVGGITIISAAEKLCTLIENKTFNESLIYCDPDNGLKKLLMISEDKLYSVNFVIQAFYRAIEILSNYGCATS
jgi:NifU-like protein involved in Fe-S cluster formation